jgi:hypothetical protein
MLPEHHSLLCDPVDIRSGEFLLPVAAQITVAQVICKDEYDVWQCLFLTLLSTGYYCKGRNDGKRQRGFHQWLLGYWVIGLLGY